MSKIGVVLSGCGVFDGSEIHEATLTLLYLDKLGLKYECIAIDEELIEEVDHTSMNPTGKKRNLRKESARIARGNPRDICEVTAKDYDGIIFPGGRGAAKNLCDWEPNGPACTVHPQIQRLIEEYHAAGKPQGFICIAPVLAGKVLGKHGVEITIGTDANVAAALESCGAKHISHAVDEIHLDAKHKVVTTPAYMLGPTISHIAKGIEKLVSAIKEMA